jgi:hypothetical protein
MAADFENNRIFDKTDGKEETTGAAAEGIQAA